ncbi:Transcription factor WhiB [Thermomonospora echinospora]|uniref:Transcription factor WhiB n=1 Tax=Thermomonospora echinospora TaxID=1992 RepID=A0A1H6DZX7_9ACTN|nr:WhiB family transcriptional regulator [Thermomonospora echinospora]SEG90225.1 Transcription factor WhiB [Thermomonospora echinospora]
MNVHPSLLPTLALHAALIVGAECQYDPELHTGPDAFADESAEDRAAREDVAAQVCASCPVRLTCFEYALRIEPEHGIWAGFTAAEITELADVRALGEVA